jgi:hypothetical protein
VSGSGLGHQLGELCGRTGQITLKYLCDSKAEAAPPRAEPVADRVGEIASLFGGRAHRQRVTRHDCGGGLLGEDLAEPPPIAQRPGQANRLGHVRAGRLRVEVAGDEAAGGQRPRQQGRVIDLARDRQGLLSPFRAVGGAHPDAERRAVGERPRPHRGRHPGVVSVVIRQGGVEPCPPFPEASPRMPQRQQRRRQRPGQFDVGVFAAPRERGANVVDLGFGLLEVLLIITARRGVEPGRQPV